jgi:tetratricopeptide (TPR) repeat protein
MERPHGQRLRLLRVLLLTGALVAGPSHAQPTDFFATATAAFEAGDYAGALDLFEAAQAGGIDSPALHYNLGVCQYRVGEYAQAAATFARLRDRFPSFAPIAEYNRGLALLALGDSAAARSAFTRARDEGDDALRALAGSALATLEPAPAPRSRWLGYFDVGAGHDDNVALVDELSLPATISASTPFNELTGYAGKTVGQRVPLRLAFSGYLVRYSDAPQFDQEALRIDTAFQWSLGDWRFESGPHFAQTILDSDGFERTLGAGLRAWHPLSARAALEIRLTYDDVDSPSDRFAFVAGTRTRMRVGVDSRGERGRVRIGYEIEDNDRAAASVSPSRDRLELRYGRRLGERWSFDGTLAYRESEYGELAAPRDEQLAELVTALRRSLKQGWLLGVEYRLADNDSDIAQFVYRSHRVSVTLGKGF